MKRSSSTLLLPPGWEEFRRAVSVLQEYQAGECERLHPVDFGDPCSWIIHSVYILYYVNLVPSIFNSCYNS